MKKIFITGGSGILGSNLARLASQKHQVIIQYNSNIVKIKNTDCVRLNLLEKEEFRKFILNEKPQVVIHTAALTNPDYCQGHREEAHKVNLEATKTIALATQEIASKLIFISTDLVFDGEKGYYKEEDKCFPLSFYAQTKYWAEEFIKGLDLNYTIIRPSIIYGFGNYPHLSFSDWLLQGFINKEERKLFTDQYRSPILVENLGNCIIEIIERDLKGLYHIGGAERISRYQFGVLMAEVFGFDSSFLIPVRASSLKLKARRPRDCSLNINKARKNLNTKILNIKEGLNRLKEIYLSMK
jgi:dTDP-4-dehydrorhamnose reductase